QNKRAATKVVPQGFEIQSACPCAYDLSSRGRRFFAFAEEKAMRTQKSQARRTAFQRWRWR
ncbi:MAG: hypothetical protein RR194_05120, partial [Ruthenibacterium sp.]